MAVGAVFYFIGFRNLEFGQNIVEGFALVIGNMLFLGSLLEYLNWLFRRLFSEKYGRFKPMVILGAIPAVISYSIIPWLPIAQLDYAVRIAILHGLFTFFGWFAGQFVSYTGMINLLTQNSQERQRLIAFTPILFGFFHSIVVVIFPFLMNTQLFGLLFRGPLDPNVYKWIVPAFSLVSLAGIYFMSHIRENLVEQKINRPKIDFWKSAKRVFSNKYWWITSVSGTLGNITAMWGNVVAWWMLYISRVPSFDGVVATITTFGWTIGHLFVPALTKKFDSKTLYLWARTIYLIGFGLIFLMFTLGQFWVIVGLMFVHNMTQSVWADIGNNFGGNILDHHQWKTGDRADAMTGIFGWIFNPINQLIGLVAPFVYLIVGFTNDWDIFWSERIFTPFFYAVFALAAIGQVLSIIPWFFYDLTTAMHKKCVDEIKERTRKADIDEIEKQKAAGTIGNIDIEILTKYGYDKEGNLLES
jgi:Na+/melibiose symporter-like transporter